MKKWHRFLLSALVIMTPIPLARGHDIRSSFMVLRTPTEGIESVLKPADGHHGIPASFRGLWWVTSQHGQSLASFADANWDPENQTLTFQSLIQGFQGRNGVDGIYKYHYSIIHPLTIVTNKMVFSKDQREVHVFSIDSDGNVKNPGADNGPGLTQVKDGLWQGSIDGINSYILQRIVKEDGTKDAAYESFLKNFGTKTADVFLRTEVMSEQSLVTELAAENTKYIEINTAKGSYRLHIKANFKTQAEVLNEGGITTNQGNGSDIIFWHDSQNVILKIKAKGTFAGPVQLEIFEDKAFSLSDKRPDLELSLASGDADKHITCLLSDWSLTGLYEIKVDADFPVRLSAIGATSFYGQTTSNEASAVNSLILPLGAAAYEQAELLVRSAGDNGGNAQLSLRPVPRNLRDKSTLVVNAPTLHTSLNSVADIDLYTIKLPPNMGVAEHEAIVLYITPYSDDPLCCVGADYSSFKNLPYHHGPYGLRSPEPRSRTVLDRDTSMDPIGAKIWISYYADKNVKNPKLNYSIVLRKEIMK